MGQMTPPRDVTPSGEPDARRLLVGVVTSARGLKGEVWVRSYTADPLAIASYGPLQDEAGSRSFVLHVRPGNDGHVAARIDGVDGRTAAEAMAGTKLYVDRAALPKPGDEEYYHADLIGLRAETLSGEPLGTVRAVHNYGAGDSLEIGDERAVILVPFTRAAVPAVHMDEGRVVIDPPAGLLPDPAAAPAKKRRRYGARPKEKAHA